MSVAPATDLLARSLAVQGLPDVAQAWTTGRSVGSFGLGSDEAVGVVMDRWTALLDALASRNIERLATATQVHGAVVTRHDGAWRGWLRLRGVDGHVSTTRGTALAVTIADCTPVFIVHPAGAVAALHAGWRGTAARILGVGLDALSEAGYPADECVIHLGPAICGACYEVGPEVLHAVTGVDAVAPGLLDVRAVLADQARRRGVKELTISEACSRCQNDHFFSHRAGDSGRQLGIIALGTGE